MDLLLAPMPSARNGMATMYEGGKVDLSWDNIWYSKVKGYSDYWIMEICHSLSYPSV